MHCYMYILNIKAIGFMVSEDFFMFFPSIRKLLTDPLLRVSDRPGQVGPKGTVGTIYAGDHKTLLYTKCINYWPLRKDFLKFLSMRAVDHQGLGQSAPEGSTRSIRHCHILYGFRSFFSIIHVATLIIGCGYF